jgi:hypothetical protein
MTRTMTRTINRTIKRDAEALVTLAGAARRFRKAARWLRDWLRDHPPPDGQPAYYLQAGNERLFSAADLARIEARMRQIAATKAASCRSRSSNRAPAKRRITPDAANTSESMLTAALRLASGATPSRSFGDGNATSNVVPLPNRPRPGARPLQARR